MSATTAIPSDHRPGWFASQSDEELLRRYADGDVEAREHLARRHMPLARRLAQRHRHSSEQREDLEQVAYLGLLKTIDRYDPALGKFVGYAVTTIRGELKRHFRDHGWALHVTRPVQENHLKVTGAVESLFASLGRSPGLSDITRDTGLPIEQVVEAMEAAHGYAPPSLDGPASADPDSDGSLGDLIGERECGYDTVELGEALGPAFGELPAREREIVGMRFVEDLTQSEIGARMGLSQMHVSRLLRRALNQMAQAVGEPFG